jgi:hypothetical protein
MLTRNNNPPRIIPPFVRAPPPPFDAPATLLSVAAAYLTACYFDWTQALSLSLVANIPWEEIFLSSAAVAERKSSAPLSTFLRGIPTSS